MGVRDFILRKKKNKGKDPPSSYPPSGEILVTAAPIIEEAQTAQDEPSLENLPDAGHPTEPPKTSGTLTEPSRDGSQSFSIWIDAYAKLEGEEQKLVKRYEKILGILIQEESNDKSTIEEDPLGNKKPAQMQMMDKAIKVGLQRTQREATLKGRFGEITRLVGIVKPVVDKAVKPSPEAAIVWSCFSFALEVLANPVTESEAQRSGIEYIISRLDWYLYLSESVLSGGKTPLGLQESLHKSLIELYKKLLGFLMKSICLYHQSRLLVTMRDLFKYDNWESQVKSIKDTEMAVQRDIDQFNATESGKRLEEISTKAAGIWEELKRWRDEEKDDKCRMAITKTIPFFSKASLLEQKGGLFPECCDWLFSSDTFKQWKDEPESRVMWISGAAGKGKTMLLCAIAEWFQYSRCLAYFFCRETDERLNNEAAILRGIIYSITEKIPTLLKHAHDNIGGLRQDGADGKQASYRTLKSILADPLASDAIIVIDALDECTQSDSNEDEAPGGILRLISELATNSSAKWVISSRNTLSAIDIQLGPMPGFLHLSLDSDHAVSDAVTIFVRMKVANLYEYIQIGSEGQDDIVNQLILGADKTFLWVSLVLSEILKTLRNKRVPNPVRFILKRIQEMPNTLDDLYWEILKRSISEADPDDGIDVKDILKVVYIAYRPLTVQELQYLIECPDLRIEEDPKELSMMFRQASAFLTVQDNVVSFIHQSAKDFITKYGSNPEVAILPVDISTSHKALFYRTVENIGDIRENIFGVEHPGMKRNELIRPERNPLAPVGYSCSYWAYHLLLSDSQMDTEVYDKIYHFLSKHFLRWMEALAWLEKLPEGEEQLENVKAWVQYNSKNGLEPWINDAYRFYVNFCPLITETPLQVYASALVFAPATSLIKKSYELPPWVIHISGLEEFWNPCSVTIEYGTKQFLDIYWHGCERLVCPVSVHGKFELSYWNAKTGSFIRHFPQPCEYLNTTVWSLSESISSSGSNQVFASPDEDVIFVWDVVVGDFRRFKLVEDGQLSQIRCAALSTDGRYLLASCPTPPRLHIWDISRRPEATDQTNWERQVDIDEFRPKVVFLTETIFVSTSGEFIYIEDVEGKHLHTLKATGKVEALTSCSKGPSRFVTKDEYDTVQLWDAISGQCIQTFDDYYATDSYPWANSSDGSMFVFTAKRDADFFRDKGYIIELWSLTSRTPSDRLRIDCGRKIAQLRLSEDKRMLASVVYENNNIAIWDTVSGAGLMVLRGHTESLASLSFSPDSRQLASTDVDHSVKIWELVAAETGSEKATGCETETKTPPKVSFSPNGEALCSVMSTSAPTIWSNKGPERHVPCNGKPWDSAWVRFAGVFFSPDCSKLALIQEPSSDDNCKVEVWDALENLPSPIWTIEHAGYAKHSFSGSVCFSHQGDLIAFNSLYELSVWSSTTRKRVSVLNCPKDSGISKFLDDDQHIVTSGSKGILMVSDVNGKHCRTIYGNEDMAWMYYNEDKIRALEILPGRLISYIGTVIKIWDTKCVPDITLRQSFDVGLSEMRLTLDQGRKLIYTNLGTLDVNELMSESSGPVGDGEVITFRGYGMDWKGTWITKDGKNVLWLPPEYRIRDRPAFTHRFVNLAIWGSMIAIGTRMGNLLVVHFSEDEEKRID